MTKYLNSWGAEVEPRQLSKTFVVDKDSDSVTVGFDWLYERPGQGYDWDIHLTDTATNTGLYYKYKGFTQPDSNVHTHLYKIPVNVTAGQEIRVCFGIDTSDQAKSMSIINMRVDTSGEGAAP